VLVGLAAVAGAALRVWVYRSSMGVPDSDEAVVGLMALHVLDGELPVFFWGQGCGGSQEALLTAPLFWAFGPSWLALRLVPIALTAAAERRVRQLARLTDALASNGYRRIAVGPFVVYARSDGPTAG
jgi:hypothetical protein